MTEYRIEKDSLGEVKVPASAYYGAQAQRASENFPISGRRMPREFVRAIGIIKRATAEANMSLALLDQRIGRAIMRAATEVVDGKFDHEFVVDVYQTGSGTSTNMNANEIISNRAIELLGGTIGSKTPVHPNDHVNRGQSSNDVIPSAIHISALEGIEKNLLTSLDGLHEALTAKARQFHKVLKVGPTHLQDAVPIRLRPEPPDKTRHFQEVSHDREGTNPLSRKKNPIWQPLGTSWIQGSKGYIAKKGGAMKRFEYEITQHPSDRFNQVVYFCSEAGECSLNEVPVDQTKILADIMNERGKQGWELVQVFFGKDGLMAFWKRRLKNRER